MSGFQCVVSIMTHWTDEMGCQMPKEPKLYMQKSAPSATEPVCLICGRVLIDGDNVLPVVATEVTGASYACLICEECVPVFDERYVNAVAYHHNDGLWDDTGMVM